MPLVTSYRKALNPNKVHLFNIKRFGDNLSLPKLVFIQEVVCKINFNKDKLRQRSVKLTNCTRYASRMRNRLITYYPLWDGLESMIPIIFIILYHLGTSKVNWKHLGQQARRTTSIGKVQNIGPLYLFWCLCKAREYMACILSFF